MGMIFLIGLALSSLFLLITMILLLRRAKEFLPDKRIVGVPRYRTGERTAPTTNRFNPWQRKTFGFGSISGPLSARPE